MKVIIPVFLFVAVLAVAQTQQRVTLELGSITVWLGEPKADVLSACTAAGYKTIESVSKASVLEILTGTTAQSHMYTVQFKAGRLSFAQRNWLSSGKDVMESVIGALETLDGKHCTISHQPIRQPDSRLDRVFVSCGDRSVLLATGELMGVRTADVMERIGELE